MRRDDIVISSLDTGVLPVDINTVEAKLVIHAEDGLCQDLTVLRSSDGGRKVDGACPSTDTVTHLLAGRVCNRDKPVECILAVVLRELEAVLSVDDGKREINDVQSAEINLRRRKSPDGPIGIVRRSKVFVEGCRREGVAR